MGQVPGRSVVVGSVRIRPAVTTLLLVLAAAQGTAHAATFSDGHGLQVQSVTQLDSRLVEVKVKTAALPGPAAVRILLPVGYDPSKRYPVFYLLHGTSGGANDWTDSGDAEDTVGNRPMIVVMPDIDLNRDGGGWCTNWPNGQYSWETFHIDQLIPWIDQNLSTITDRGGRAIAGLSQGGFCSLSYAARHPDLFSIALGYSGAPEIYYDPQARAGAKLIINATEMGLDHVAPDTMFGNIFTDGINWAAHDPATLAENLRWTRMYMYWGNGFPGPYDTGPPNGGANLIEGAVDYDNQYFQQRLNSLNIPAFYDAYGNGTHSFAYWASDLRKSIDKIQADFDNPAPDPAQFTYTSADAAYSVYGFDVATHRAVREFSTLKRIAPDQFSLSGSGSATVSTPATYTPGAHYTVTRSGNPPADIVADAEGRLQIEVPLGADNAVQQDIVPDQAGVTKAFTTLVTIAAA
jgi:S-formylglutathione hydrolase FrmB